MTKSKISRRNFQQLTAAALGGLVAGVSVGCGGKESPPPEAVPTNNADEAPSPQGSDTSGQETLGSNSDLNEEQLIMLQEPHVCRGLNSCEGMGAGKDNACAGQGTCATATAHACHEMNECKGQGGCGETAGRNACKGQGECAVPLQQATWEKARQAYEQAMQDADKSFGEAPAKG